MDEITAKAFSESLLSTQHYTKYSFTPLSYEAFTIIPFYESGLNGLMTSQTLQT